MPGEATAGDRVIIVNDVLATQLFGESDPIDKSIDVNGQPFKVLGVYHYEASFLSGGNMPAVSHEPAIL